MDRNNKTKASRWVGVGMLTVVALLAPRSARADESDDLIKRGIESRRKQDDAAGLRFFEKAYELGHSPRALAQMGLAEQALGKWVPASEHLREALAIHGNPWIEKNRAILDESVTRIADHVGFIEIFGGTPGAEIRLDGVARGTLPLPRPLATTTGTVAVDLTMPGRLPIRRTTTVRAGETTREAFDDLPVEANATPAGAHDDRSVARRVDTSADKPADSTSAGPDATVGSKGTAPGGGGETPPPAGEHRRSVRLPLVLGTAALAVGAAIFGKVEYGHYSDNVDSFMLMSCDTRQPDNGGKLCTRFLNDGKHEQTLEYVGFAAAGALAATSVILFFVLDDGGAPASQRVACLPDPGTRGVGCSFRF